MKRSKSSNDWIREHENDEYVLKARKAGYRCRAVYKLLEIQEKDKIIKSGMRIVDLGAAPGGWSQVLVELVGKKSQIVAMDILPMEPIEAVEFIQGDFREQAILAQLLNTLGGEPVDLVISDIAPNMSGSKTVDQPRSMHLVDLAVDFAKQTLCPGGGFVCKVFQGEGFDDLMRDLKQQFTKVVTRKPKASRPRSPEVYVVATGFKAS